MYTLPRMSTKMDGKQEIKSLKEELRSSVRELRELRKTNERLARKVEKADRPRKPRLPNDYNKAMSVYLKDPKIADLPSKQRMVQANLMWKEQAGKSE
jgi:predicted nuclease with TOPRIM domain